MQKLFAGLLLAGFAVTPALADKDKGDKGHKNWKKVEREWRGDHGKGAQRWDRGQAWDNRPVRVVRIERDDDDRDGWEDRDDRARLADYRAERAYLAREQARARFSERRAQQAYYRDGRDYDGPSPRVIRYLPEQTYVRYIERPISYVPYSYAQPNVRYGDPVRYAARTETGFGSGFGGLLGGGNGLLGALLPVALASFGGGDFGGLAGLGGLGGLGGLSANGFGSPTMLPIDSLGLTGPLASGFVPSGDNGGLSSMLPALLNGGGSLF